MKTYNIIDLFSGCGGLSCGFMQAGYNVLLGVDNNKVAIETFKVNHPLAKALHADLNTLTGKEIKKIVNNKKIDLIIGGPPCQGFSVSGPRQFDDPRNKLYLSFMRIVREVKPKAFMIENVPGILGLYGGQIKDEILRRFSSLGYDVSFKKLNSADFGVPQSRNRVFFVGIYKAKKSFEFPEPVLNKNSYIKLKDAIGDLPSLENGFQPEIFSYPQNGHLSNYQKYCRRNSDKVANHIKTNHAPRTQEIIALVPEGGNYKDLPVKFSRTRNFHVAWTRFHGEKPAPTIDTGHRHHFHYKYNRVPTVRECARIQSFPDNFIFMGNKTQQYLQVGNAVPPLLAKAIAEKIKNYL